MAIMDMNFRHVKPENEAVHDRAGDLRYTRWRTHRSTHILILHGLIGLDPAEEK